MQTTICECESWRKKKKEKEGKREGELWMWRFTNTPIKANSWNWNSLWISSLRIVHLTSLTIKSWSTSAPYLSLQCVCDFVCVYVSARADVCEFVWRGKRGARECVWKKERKKENNQRYRLWKQERKKKFGAKLTPSDNDCIVYFLCDWPSAQQHHKNHTKTDSDRMHLSLWLGLPARLRYDVLILS